MKNISVNFMVLLINGIPQSLLTILAVHIFTRTKIYIKKYLLLSLMFAIATYLIRFLPIAIGVNTVLSLFVIVIEFEFTYKPKLSKLIRIIASAIVTFLMIVISEILNMLLLTAMYGQDHAIGLLNSSNGLIQGLSTIPINIFLGAFVCISYLVLKQVEKRKVKDGEAGS